MHTKRQLVTHFIPVTNQSADRPAVRQAPAPAARTCADALIPGFARWPDRPARTAAHHPNRMAARRGPDALPFYKISQRLTATANDF
jgi:hypothetical protein